VDDLFSAKDAKYMSPKLLADAVRAAGGLIHNNHPSRGEEGRDQFDYPPEYSPVIANTEMGADVVHYGGKAYRLDTERIVRRFLNAGGRTGFVKGTDTHEGKPAARTAVVARSLTREAIFEALRHRRNYAASHARIVLDFRIDGHKMGEEVETDGPPCITVRVRGTDRLQEVALIRDGAMIHCVRPDGLNARLTYVDTTFRGNSYYYARVTQVDSDEHGNPSQAWSSPIWVTREQ
jgi:hypothetical protein